MPNDNLLNNVFHSFFKKKTDEKKSKLLDNAVASFPMNFETKTIEFVEASIDADPLIARLKTKYSTINAGHKNQQKSNTTLNKNGEKISESLCNINENSSQKDEYMNVIGGVPTNIKWTRIRPVGPGLVNCGNTCFINSVIQVLTYTPPLWEFLISESKHQSCNIRTVCIVCQLKKHYLSVNSKPRGTLAPHYILSNLKHINKCLKIGRQQDAHEFLRYFIDAIQSNITNGVNGCKKEYNTINWIFGGTFQSQVVCTSCKSVSTKIDPLMEINLDIQNCNSIQSALEQFIKPEYLQKNSYYSCTKCGKVVTAIKTVKINRAPIVLTIQLKRFQFCNGFGGKINKRIIYNEQLDLKPYLVEKSDCKSTIYDLYAIIVHQGSSTNSGHYYSYVKGSNGIWHELNDEMVRTVSTKEVLSGNAYMLFYLVHSSDNCKENQWNKTMNIINNKLSSESFSINTENTSKMFVNKKDFQNGFQKNAQSISANNSSCSLTSKNLSKNNNNNNNNNNNKDNNNDNDNNNNDGDDDQDNNNAAKNNNNKTILTPSQSCSANINLVEQSIETENQQFESIKPITPQSTIKMDYNSNTEDDSDVNSDSAEDSDSKSNNESLSTFLNQKTQFPLTFPKVHSKHVSKMWDKKNPPESSTIDSNQTTLHKPQFNLQHLKYSHNKLGDSVLSWDDKVNNVDKLSEYQNNSNQKRLIDEFDADYDRGKLKKVKVNSSKNSISWSFMQNPFQTFYSNRYIQGSNTSKSNKNHLKLKKFKPKNSKQSFKFKNKS